MVPSKQMKIQSAEHKDEGYTALAIAKHLHVALKNSRNGTGSGDMILFYGPQIAPILKYTDANKLMLSLIEETAGYFDRLQK
jgi:hypothetical protein